MQAWFKMPNEIHFRLGSQSDTNLWGQPCGFRGLAINETDGTVRPPVASRNMMINSTFRTPGSSEISATCLASIPACLRKTAETATELAQFKAYLKEESKDLANARRDRDIEATKSRIVVNSETQD